MKVLEKVGFILGQQIDKSFIKSFIKKKIDSFDIKTIGVKNLPVDSSFIIASNHLRHCDQGLLRSGISADTFIFYKVVKEITSKKIAVSANFLYDNRYLRPILEPFSKGVIEGCSSIPVGKGKEHFHQVFLKTVEKAVKEKRPILIYPAGRQEFDFEDHHELKAGAAYLSIKYQIPIIPTYIKGAHYWNKKGQKVSLSFGKPIYPQKNTIDGLNQILKREILELKRKSTG